MGGNSAASVDCYDSSKNVVSFLSRERRTRANGESTIETAGVYPFGDK